jgi:hypothetical protein
MEDGIILKLYLATAQKGVLRMKRWFTKSLMLSIIVLLVLALVPAVSAEEDEFGTVYSGGEWFVACGDYSYMGYTGGLARVGLADRIPPEFYLIDTFYVYSAQYGILENFSRQLNYSEFSTEEFYWYIPVPLDGYSIVTTKVYDNGGGLVSISSITADCTTGEIHVGNGSVYGPKVPTGFELRSLSCSSAVLDVPGGEQVEENAVYAGQSWFVNPTPKAGPDGKNYTEIFVGGWTTGYIPTECVGGVPSFSAE